jgi:hypothetical protein
VVDFGSDDASAFDAYDDPTPEVISIIGVPTILGGCCALTGRAR